MPLSRLRSLPRQTPGTARLRRYPAAVPERPSGGQMELTEAHRRKAISLMRIPMRDDRPTQRLRVPVVRAGHPTIEPVPWSDREESATLPLRGHLLALPSDGWSSDPRPAEAAG